MFRRLLGLIILKGAGDCCDLCIACMDEEEFMWYIQDLVYIPSSAYDLLIKRILWYSPPVVAIRINKFALQWLPFIPFENIQLICMSDLIKRGACTEAEMRILLLTISVSLSVWWAPHPFILQPPTNSDCVCPLHFLLFIQEHRIHHKGNDREIGKWTDQSGL